jgi:hypothetical protein
MAELNRSQGEIYIRGGGRIDLGAAGRFCCASLKHGPAAALHLLVSVGQLGETVAHFLLCCGPGAQAYVGGHFLARSAPGGLGVVEVRTVWAVSPSCQLFTDTVCHFIQISVRP